MLNPSGNTWTTSQPYGKVDYMLASFNDTDGGASGHSAPYFDGRLSTRVISDFGGFNVNIRPNSEDKLGTRNVECEDNNVAMDNDNTIYNSGDSGCRFVLSSYFIFGLQVGLVFFSNMRALLGVMV